MSSRNNAHATPTREALDAPSRSTDASTRKSKQRSQRRLVMAGLTMATTAYTFCTIDDYTSLGIGPELLSQIFFLCLFFGIPVYAMAKCLIQTDDKDYSEFDVIVTEVSKSVEPEAGDLLKDPLLQPPSNAVLQIENRQHGITNRKDGKSVRPSAVCSGTLRLNFATTPNGVSISGSTTLETSKSTSNFVIQKGFVNVTSGKAWWEEANSTGHRHVISGEFADAFTSFSGEWYANDGTRGSLVTIENTNISVASAIDYAVPVGEEELFLNGCADVV